MDEIIQNTYKHFQTHGHAFYVTLYQMARRIEKDVTYFDRSFEIGLLVSEPEQTCHRDRDK